MKFDGRRSVLLLGACAWHCFAHGSPATQVPVRLPADVLPTRYTLDLSIDPAKDTFEGAVSIELTFATDTQRFWLHGQDLIVRQATLTSQAELKKIPAKMEIVSADGTAQVTMERPVAAGRAVLDIRYVGQFNPRLQGLYVARSNGGAYVGSQMEPIGARRVLPCFDEPRFKVPFSVSLTVPTGMAAISNAAPVGIETTSDGRRRHRFATTAPLPTYLLAFLVGPYEIVEGQPLPASELRNEPVALRAIAAHGKADGLAAVLTDTPAVINYLEHYFGIPYRYGKLDLIAVPAFPGGAMENAGAIVYREASLLVPPNAPRTQWRNYFTTHTHELAHQWFGNYVTPAWWEDLWLNESFATWLGNKTAHALVPNAAFDRETIMSALKAMEMDSLVHTRRIREPVVRNEAIAGAFDAITYLKGAGVLTMIERYMGEERFRAGVRLYMQKYPDGVATSEQFFEALAAKAEDPGVLLALRSFVDQPHIPLLQVDMLCSTDSDPVARVVQTPYRAVGSAIASDRSWVIPLSFVYEAQGGRKQVQTLMRQSQADITLAGAHCPAWLLPNAAGAGYWRFNLDDDHWLALLGAFAKLTPGEQLVTLDSLAAAFRANAVPAKTYLQGLDVAVQAGSWDVVLAAARELGEGPVARALPDNSLMRDRLVRLLGARGRTLVKLHPTGGEEEILRAELARLLVSKARDRQLIERLGTAVIARGYSAFDRDPDLRTATAGATALLLNGKLPKKLFEAALLETDQAKRADVLVGMAGNVAVDSVEAIFESIQSRRIAAQDLVPIMRELLRNAETRDATWNWMKAHAELLAAQIPELYKSTFPSVAAHFCDASMTAQLEDFFGRHRDDFSGAERVLAQTVEQIRLCAALRTLRADELSAALASAH